MRAFCDHACLDCIEGSRADIAVDVRAVGLDAHGDDFRAQFPDRAGRDLVRRAVGAIDYDLEAVEAHVARHRLLHRVDVAPAGIVDPARAADPVGADEEGLLRHQRLDRHFRLVRQLVAIGAEQLDAVILERIVAGGDHHAEVGAHLAGEERNGRRGQRPGHDHVHADAGEAGDQRAFDHIARQARILADHDPVLVPAAQEMRTRRLADLHRDLGGHHAFVGAAANSVGAEVCPCHESLS